MEGGFKKKTLKHKPRRLIARKIKNSDRAFTQNRKLSNTGGTPQSWKPETSMAQRIGKRINGVSFGNPH
jgi:hypothetical protein